MGYNPSTGEANDESSSTVRLEAEMAHLTCFTGGMYAMSAKIFDREEDLEIGRKLTEGCVWAYNMTASGIMPESFNVIPCKSKDSCSGEQSRLQFLISHFFPQQQKRRCRAQNG